ncbi:heterokaryon incompatibility protein-domain-containing protein [Lasiosphaeria hispida]|uniref:Heterokaryon incompatibility protein-domain-containing protein n=1 Tax=Lasiosphaeria hispida TaxID=260671 RepID=A0AAJ0HCJ6_9PEZI|nr:heterokaryon incompatibility protein-domain-containing protein [Lasiosphaeria hispida]
MPLCNTCRDSLENVWDSASTRRVGFLSEWVDEFSDVMGSEEAFSALLARLGDCEEDSLGMYLEPERHIYSHHSSRASWEASRDLGCLVCQDLSPETSGEQNISGRLQRSGWYSVFALSLTGAPFMFILSGGSSEAFGFDPVGTAHNLNFNLGPSTSSPQTWDLIQKWTHDCNSHHPECHASRRTDFMPSRTLELDPAAQTYRLVLATEVPRGTRYITLSHCWGSLAGRTDVLMLTRTTLPQLRTARPVASLPPTFQDAFDIAARFRIRHLWIDRLCIVQDSAADWAAEAASMHDIYKHPYLNVSALGASDDQGGCFRTRDPATMAPAAVRLRTACDGISDDYALRRDAAGPEWYNEWLAQPLIRRAWIVQERLLPARVLHFGSRQVFWECMTVRACETSPRYLWDGPPLEREMGDAAGAGGAAREWKRLIEIPNFPADSLGSRAARLLAEWGEHVAVYSGCKLTVAGDRLVALSGLARDMQQRLEGVGVSSTAYCAGLWKCDLPGSLLWHKRPGHVPPAPPTAYRAPSWSWAAVDGGVSGVGGGGAGWGGDGTLLAEVLRAETTARGADQLGPVSGGTLTLCAPLATVRQGGLVEEDVNTCYGPRGILFTSLVGTTRDDEQVELCQEKEHLETQRNGLFDGCDVFPDWEDSCSLEGRLFCLPVEMTESEVELGGSGRSTRWLRYRGLVLTQSEGSSGLNAYRRVGFFFIDFGSEYCNVVEKFFHSLSRTEVNII